MLRSIFCRAISCSSLSFALLTASSYAQEVQQTPPSPTEAPTQEATAAPHQATGEERSPNIIIILANDMQWGDYAANGNEQGKTSSISELSRQSLCWDSFYVSPAGSLTRASLLTGRYNPRTKCLDTSLGRSMMASDEVTIAEALEGAGYTTGLFGKWNLGDNYPMRPSDQGFEYSLTHRGDSLVGSSAPLKSKSTNDPILLLNNRETPFKGKSTDIFFEQAIDFVKKAHDFNRPFFALISPDLTSHQDDAETMLKNFDTNIGKFIHTLDDQQILNNTILIYLQETGGNKGYDLRPLRGNAQETYEIGVRSPLIICWKDKLGPRVIHGQAAAHIDIMPTILDACGLGVPEALGFDGISLLETIQDPAAKALPERPIVMQYHLGAKLQRGHNAMLRMGDWKLVQDADPLKYDIEAEHKPELFNIAKDPKEMQNLADQHPEKVKELLALYDAWYDDVTQTRIREKGTPYIFLDSKEQNPVTLTLHERVSKAEDTSSPGFWRINFQHAAFIQADLYMQPHELEQLKGWKAIFQIDKDIYIGDKPVSDSRVITFPGIKAKRGKSNATAYFRSPDGKKIHFAYQVRLTHR